MSENILISACLLGEKCRFDGRDSRIHELEEADVNWIPVCPEELGGLGTPRPAAEIQPDGRIINNEGKDVTSAFQKGSEDAMKIAESNGCRKAVLKSKSPSCGKNRIYDGSFSRTFKTGNGVFAQSCLDEGMKVFCSDEEYMLEKIKTGQ